MSEIIRILGLKDFENEQSRLNLCKARMFVSVVLAFAAGVMLLINLKNKSMLMAYSSMVLVAGFLISALFAGIFKKAGISAVIIALLVCFVLTIFAVSGGNEGFAILWVLLVPTFAVSLLGVISGIGISTYFLIFLFVIFKTPLQVYFLDKYSVSFISRFPILYLADYLIATFFSVQKEYFHKKLQHQAYSDGMTGLYNRRYFIEKLKVLENAPEEYSLVMVDLNGLKRVNDDMGHEKGDDFICRVARLCKDFFKKNADVCRIGGDEIAIVAYGEKEKIKKKIDELIKASNKENSKVDYNLSFSTGIASCEDSESNPELLFKKADEEMYKNKVLYYQNGKNDRRKERR